MAYETIIVDVENHVALITLNRPDALNALNAQLLGELADAMTACQANDKVRCIVLTGSEKAFAAGADIAMMREMTFVEAFTTDLFTPETDQILRVRKPIIAAVSGYALGGGAELAMMCDFIICSETAKFGQPEINQLPRVRLLGLHHVAGLEVAVRHPDRVDVAVRGAVLWGVGVGIWCGVGTRVKWYRAR